ncbi:hypothetical protein A9R05_21330 [Burkholderia sp. KK1]|nr:hypothetical protein A9R05_21330 [Burkholderia sp. KK1]
MNMSLEELEYFKNKEAKAEDLAGKIYREGNVIFVQIGEMQPVRKPIPVSQVSTPEGLLGWTYELARHRWMDGDRIRRFMEVASEAGGVQFEKLV